MDVRLAMIVGDLEAVGGALDGLILLGCPGGASWLRARSAGITMAEGVAEDGSVAELLVFGDGTAAIASLSPEGNPVLASYADPADAWRAWNTP